MRTTVIGGGSWGTALAHLAARKGNPVTVLVRSPEQAREISESHVNSAYLPGLALAPGLQATADAAKALEATELCILAVPCQHMRRVLSELAPLLPKNAVPVCASKGIEISTLLTMREVVHEVLPEQATRYAILSGPTFAREVVEDKPAAAVLGCADSSLGEALRQELSTPLFRVYSSQDVAGVELGGAVKNVMAIAAGMCDGLGLGDNSRAALITRGLAEMSRLGVALGANPATFMGLSGLGDLALTCTGALSRNRQVGLRLAAGESAAQIAASMRMVAEGVPTATAVCALGERNGVDLPIARAVRRVIEDGAKPAEIVTELMTRTLKEE